jgi:hypothetical protein
MVEHLFGVGPRTAQNLLRLMGGRLAGGALVIEREQALVWLKAQAAAPSVCSELSRIARLESSLDAARRHWRARRVIVNAPPPTAGAGFQEMPGAINLRPGELRIAFTSAQELLERLVRLSQAILNDFERFEQLAGHTSKHLDV